MRDKNCCCGVTYSIPAALFFIYLAVFVSLLHVYSEDGITGHTSDIISAESISLGPANLSKPASYKIYTDDKGGVFFYDSEGQYYVQPNLTLNDHERQKYAKDMLLELNRLRALHGSPPVILKPAISNYSQWWANVLYSRKTVLYSSSHWRPRYGECVHWTAVKYVPPKLVIDGWYEERFHYNNFEFPDNRTVLRAARFTQLVWRGSEYIGVGIAGDENNFYVVINFEPKGNILGEYEFNVLPTQGPTELPPY